MKKSEKPVRLRGKSSASKRKGGRSGVGVKLELLTPYWTPHPGQRRFLEHPSRFKVLACGRRWGKTDACAAQIVASFFESSPTRHVILAPTQDQANLLFARVLAMLDAIGAGDLAEHRKSPYPTLQFGIHRLTARSGHLGHALRGNEATHLVVDEASYLPESLITEVAMPMMATTNGYVTLIGTPNGRNHFWRFFEMGRDGRHGVWSSTGHSSDSPFVSSSFLAMQRELISDRAYRVEYEAEFMDSVGQFFSTDSIHGCVVAKLPSVDGYTYIGVDWGRAQDSTAVAVLQGTSTLAVLHEAHSFSNLPWDLLAERVAAVIRRYPGAMVLTDATGSGDPMLGMLRRTVPDWAVKGLTFNQENKTEMAFGLTAMLEHRRLAMKPHPELMRELQYYEMSQNDLGHCSFGAAQGLHDDLVTALMLAARLIAPPLTSVLRRGRERTWV